MGRERCGKKQEEKHGEGPRALASRVWFVALRVSVFARRCQYSYFCTKGVSICTLVLVLGWRGCVVGAARVCVFFF